MKTFREMLSDNYDEPLAVILMIQENLTKYAEKLGLRDFSCRHNIEKTFYDTGQGIVHTGDNSEIETSFLPVGVSQHSKFSKLMTMYRAYSTGPMLEYQRKGVLYITETWKF